MGGREKGRERGRKVSKEGMGGREEEGERIVRVVGGR